MHDRLTSVKFSRSVRNVCLALAVVLFLEFFILLLGTFLNHMSFNPRTLVFPALACVFGWLAWYYHGRFRSRD
jgi:hypothetical protein